MDEDNQHNLADNEKYSLSSKQRTGTFLGFASLCFALVFPTFLMSFIFLVRNGIQVLMEPRWPFILEISLLVSPILAVILGAISLILGAISFRSYIRKSALIGFVVGTAELIIIF